jgi:outer membrane lipoprotein-sorting protein
MKKSSVIFASLLLLSGTFLNAQELDEVLKNHFAAIGQEKLVKVTSLKTTGKLVQQGLEIPFLQYAKRPGSVRIEGTFQGLTFLQTYNGKEGWNLNPFAGITDPQPMGEDELKQMKYSADLDGMLWNWKEKEYTVTLDGKEDVEGTSCFKVKLVTKEGDTFSYYIDADAYVLIRSNTKMKVQGNEVESDTFYSNYSQYEGLALPGKIETKVGGNVVMTIITDKVEVNPELAESMFEKPAK